MLGATEKILDLQPPVLSSPGLYIPMVPGKVSVPTLPSEAAAGPYLFWGLSLPSLNPERKNHKTRCLLEQRPTLRVTLENTHPSQGCEFIPELGEKAPDEEGG